MMKLFYSFILLLLSVSPVRAMEYINGEPQGGGAAIGSYEDVVGLWDTCGSLFMKGDGTCSAVIAVETDPTVDTSAEIQAIIGVGVYQTPLSAGTDYLAPTGDGSGLSGVVTSETDPVFGAWDRSTGISITSSQITDITTYLTYADITALWTDCTAGVLMADSTCVVLGSAASSATTDFDPAGSAAAVQDLSNYALSPFIVTGGDISEGTNAGTFKVSALTAYLRTTDSLTGDLDYVTLAEQDNQAITLSNTVYYVGLNYNGGSPTISLSLACPYEAVKTSICIGKVMKDESDNIHYISDGFDFQDSPRKFHERVIAMHNLEFSKGGVISYKATNAFTSEDMTAYSGGTSKWDLGIYDSTSTNFITIYWNGAAFVEAAANPPGVLDFEHYDDGNSLENVSVAKYSTKWVYRHVDDGDVYVRYGNINGSLAEAEQEDEPSKPQHLIDMGILIGKIIMPQAGGSLTVQMAWEQSFSGSAVSDHGSLGGLTDDADHPQYLLNSLFDAYTMIYADTDDTPAALAFTTYSLGGRLDAGFVNIPIDSTEECASGSVCGGGHEHSAAASQAITDNAILTVDDAAAADNDMAIFTAYGIEGVTVAEFFAGLDDITWGAAAGGSQTHTYDTGAGTDPAVTVSDTGWSFNKTVTATGFEVPATAAGGQYSYALEDTGLGTSIAGFGVYGDLAHSTIYAYPLAAPTAGQVMAWAVPGNQTMSDGTTKSVSVGTFVLPLTAADVDDTPVDSETAQPVSSNWAYDHAANVSAHHTATVDTNTNAGTECTGATTYLNGEGSCVEIGAVYANDDGDTYTGTHDYGGATLEIPNSNSLPGTCTVGQAYMDTDATTGQRMYLCESTDTWALQGAGGGAPAEDSITTTMFKDGADTPTAGQLVVVATDTTAVEYVSALSSVAIDLGAVGSAVAVTDADGVVGESATITVTELGYLNSLTGVTGTGNLVASAAPVLTGTVDMGGAVLEIPNTDADPAAVGQLRLDTTVTNYANGALRWSDGTAIKQAVDMIAATAEGCTDDYVVAYDSTLDGFYCKADATGAAGTAFSDLSSATNTTAAMVVGNDASLTVSGTGTINATSLGGTAAASYALLAGGTFSGNLVLDDGTGDSPTITLTDATDETTVINKIDSGYTTFTTAAADGVKVLVGNLAVGGGSPGQTINGEDFYVTGLAEFDGMIHADGGINAGTVGLASTGTISGALAINAVGASCTIGTDCAGGAGGAYGGIYLVSGNYTVTLPAVAIGMNLCVYSTTAAAVLVDPNDSDGIILNGVARDTDGHTITSESAAGDFVCLFGDSADGWTTLGRSGTWTSQ